MCSSRKEKKIYICVPRSKSMVQQEPHLDINKECTITERRRRYTYIFLVLKVCDSGNATSVRTERKDAWEPHLDSNKECAITEGKERRFTYIFFVLKVCESGNATSVSPNVLCFSSYRVTSF